MDSLGNFPFAVSLSANSLIGIIVADEVLNQQFAATPPSAGTISGTGIPINFAATVDGQQATFKRNPITASSITLVAAPSMGNAYIQSLWATTTMNAPAPTTAASPPQPPAISGKGAVTILVTGQAQVAGTSVPFSLTLAFFIRQARALEVTPAGFPALRAAATPAFAQIPDVLVAVNSNGQFVPANSGLPSILAGDLIRQFNDIDGIHDGLPLDQSTGTGLNQPTVLNQAGQPTPKYVIASPGGIAQLVDPSGTVVAQQYGGTLASKGLLQVFLDVVGIVSFELNSVAVNDLATAVQTLLGESATASFDGPTPFAYRIPLDVFPAFADPVTIRNAVASTLDSVILDPVSGNFCTTTAWVLLQLLSGPGAVASNETQLKQNLPAPPLGDLLLVDAAVVGGQLVAGLKLGLMPQNFPYGLNPIPLNATVCGGPGPFPNPSSYPGMHPGDANTATLTTTLPPQTDSTQINLPIPGTGAADFVWAMSKSVLQPQLNTLIPNVLASNDPMSVSNPGESQPTVLSQFALQPPGVSWGPTGPTLSISGRFAYPLYLNIRFPLTGYSKLVFLRFLHGSFVVSNMSLSAGVACTPSGPGIGCGAASLGRAFCDPEAGTCPVAGLTATGPYQDCYDASSLPPLTPPNASTPPMTRINDLTVSMTGGQMSTTLDPGDEAYLIGLSIVVVIGSIMLVPILMTLLPALFNALSSGQNTPPSGPPQGRSAWARVGLANGGGLGAVTANLYTQSAQFTGDGLVLGCRLVTVGSLSTLGAVADAGSGCLIATATFGTPLHPRVRTLRRFRDEVLRQRWWGRIACAIYRKTSPPVAALVRRSQNLRRAIRPSIALAASACERRLTDKR